MPFKALISNLFDRGVNFFPKMFLSVFADFYFLRFSHFKPFWALLDTHYPPGGLGRSNPKMPFKALIFDIFNKSVNFVSIFLKSLFGDFHFSRFFRHKPF